MFFYYCIILKRSSEEFWNCRPSQIIYCIQKYFEIADGKQREKEEVTEITSMRDIAGWGDKA